MKTIAFILFVAALGFCGCKKESPAPSVISSPANAPEKTDLGRRSLPKTTLEKWYFHGYLESRTLFPINSKGEGC